MHKCKCKHKGDSRSHYRLCVPPALATSRVGIYTVSAWSAWDWSTQSRFIESPVFHQSPHRSIKIVGQAILGRPLHPESIYYGNVAGLSEWVRLQSDALGGTDDCELSVPRCGIISEGSGIAHQAITYDICTGGQGVCGSMSGWCLSAHNGYYAGRVSSSAVNFVNEDDNEKYLSTNLFSVTKMRCWRDKNILYFIYSIS